MLLVCDVVCTCWADCCIGVGWRKGAGCCITFDIGLCSKFCGAATLTATFGLSTADAVLFFEDVIDASFGLRCRFGGGRIGDSRLTWPLSCCTTLFNAGTLPRLDWILLDAVKGILTGVVVVSDSLVTVDFFGRGARFRFSPTTGVLLATAETSDCCVLAEASIGG